MIKYVTPIYKHWREFHLKIKSKERKGKLKMWGILVPLHHTHDVMWKDAFCIKHMPLGFIFENSSPWVKGHQGGDFQTLSLPSSFLYITFSSDYHLLWLTLSSPWLILPSPTRITAAGIKRSSAAPGDGNLRLRRR